MNTKIGQIVPIAIIFLLIIIASSSAAEVLAYTNEVYFVDAINGSDTSGSGSQSSPWRTITHALSHINKGDTLMILPGTYDAALGENFPITLLPGVKLIGAGRDTTYISGQSDVSVLYIGSSSTYFSANTLVSDLTLQNGEIGLEMYASERRVVEPTISNLRIRWNDTGIYLSTGEVYEDGATISASISNSEIISNSGDGIYMEAFGYFSSANITPTFTKCLIQDNAENGFFVTARATGVNGTQAAPEILDSQISNNGGHGIYTHGSYDGWAKPLVYRSFILENNKYGLYWEEGVNGGSIDAVFHNSVIARNQEGGIYLGYRSGSGTQPSRLQLINSNLIQNIGYGIYWKRSDREIKPLVVNSILWNVNADDLFSTQGAWTTDEVHHTIIEDGDLAGVSGNISLDPRLLDDYHLTACSPAIDAGTFIREVFNDLDGEPRPQGNAYDIGADELDTPCRLDAQKAVSAKQAQIGDNLTYTITLQNTTVITSLNISLTDVLPQEVSYKLGTLWASRGTPQYNAGAISWLGSIAPGDMITIGLQTQIKRGDSTIINLAKADAGEHGEYYTQNCVTMVPPAFTYLPLIGGDFCTQPILDDFSDPQSGWPIAESDSWTIGYLNDEYRLYAHLENSFVAVTRGDKVNRFAVEVDARQTNRGSLGLIFGLKPDWSEFYTFEIYPLTQQYAVFHYDGGWDLLFSGSSIRILPNQGTNRLRIAWSHEVGGFDYYSFFVNEHQIRNYTFWSSTTPSRLIGLTATSTRAGFSAYFDNYKLLPEGCLENLSSQSQFPESPVNNILEIPNPNRPTTR